MDVENWDVEKYKVEHECDEHWELRKNFLETHKDRFPIDQLVCLAQVFSNIELLGCRYPEETMDLVAELSEDIAKDYRAKQKTKLQRTFVKASDAASSKAKGRQSTPTMSTGQSPSPSNSDNKKNNVRKKKLDYDDDEDDEQQQCKKSRIQKNNQPYGNIVLLQSPDHVVQNTLSTLGGFCGKKVEWKYQMQNNNKLCECQILIDGKILSVATGATKKISRAEAAQIGFDKLRKDYYLIELKKDWKDGLNNNPSDLKKANELGKLSNNGKANESLGADNIGAKLMKLMGWSGGGLGKSQQGITEPISVSKTISKQGFGMKLTSSNMQEFKEKCRETCQDYVRNGAKNDLIFVDFNSEERAIMHLCAQQVGLKSKSYTQNGQRTLVVTRKIDPLELVEELLAAGGSTDKYILSPPTGS